MTRIVIARPALLLPRRLLLQIEAENAHQRFQKEFWQAFVAGLFITSCFTVALKLGFTGHKNISAGIALLPAPAIAWLVIQAGLRNAPVHAISDSSSNKSDLVIPRND